MKRLDIENDQINKNFNQNLELSNEQHEEKMNQKNKSHDQIIHKQDQEHDEKMNAKNNSLNSELKKMEIQLKNWNCIIIRIC